jgi:hypothetical protein
MRRASSLNGESAYYQDEGWEAQVGRHEAAVFAVHGWTEDLFPAVEVFRQYKDLKRLDTDWPVSGGRRHGRAQALLPLQGELRG